MSGREGREREREREREGERGGGEREKERERERERESYEIIIPPMFSLSTTTNLFTKLTNAGKATKPPSPVLLASDDFIAVCGHSFYSESTSTGEIEEGTQASVGWLWEVSSIDRTHLTTVNFCDKRSKQLAFLV